MAGTLLGVPWIIQMARGPIRWRRLMIVSEPPMLFAGAVVAVTAWRMYYYGDFVPNTFHAKVGQVPASAGWTYLEKFLSDGPLLLLPPVLFGLVVQPRLRLPALFVLATTTYTVSIGGDVFAFGRFLLPVLPVLLAAASAAITWTIERNMAAGISLALILPATAAVSVAGRVAPPFIPFASDFDWAHLPPSETVFSGKRMVAERHWFFIDEKRHVRMLAAKVREAKPGARLIACIGIGKFGYYNMDFIILDMVGLTDRHIAQSERMVPGTWLLPGHSRTDSDYVLSRKPDVILLPGMDGLHPGQLPAVEDMLANPKLQQEYVYHEGSIWVRK
jgi:arabinofuranosyltransferase